MPNQWVKLIPHPDYPLNAGCIIPVHHGRPVGPFHGKKSYDVPVCLEGLAHGLLTHKLPNALGLCVDAAQVELLGPDECAELDRKYGLKGTESDEP